MVFIPAGQGPGSTDLLRTTSRALGFLFHFDVPQPSLPFHLRLEQLPSHSIGDELSIVTCADIRVRSLFDEGEIFFKQEFDQPCFLGTLLKIAKAYMPLASETC